MGEAGDKYPPRICRLCLSKTVSCFSLIDNSEFSAMLEALTSLRILPTDEISTIMCLKCRLNLKLAFTIQQNMVKAEERFRRKRASALVKQEVELESDDGVAWDSSDLDEGPALATKEPKRKPPEATCEVCGVVRSSRSAVKRHKLNCHGERVHCPVCSKEINPCHFKRHSELHEKRAEMAKNPDSKVGYTCSVCGKVKLTRTTLTQHLYRHRMAKCWICQKVMPKGEIQDHTVLCKGRSAPIDHTCDSCGVSKPTRAILERHKRTHVLTSCTECGKEVNVENLKKHMTTHSDGSVYTCDICGKVKPSKHSLARHKDSVHNSDQGRCTICGMVMLKFNLKKHVERHNKTSFTVCEMCGKSVYTPDIRAHMRHNHREQEFECKLCDQTFQKIHQLQKHRLREHQGNTANYMCDTCGRKFLSGASLQKHVQSAHLKLRPHVCGVCKVGFSSPYSLKTHQRQHTNETPYKCDICGDGFRQKVSLKTHLRSKHQIKEELTHECTTCGKKFESEFAVITHARVHK